MRWWLIVLLALGCKGAQDTLVEEFHAVERGCLGDFIAAMNRERSGEIDELRFAQTLERDILPRWHAFRLRVDQAPDSEVVRAMRRYFADREDAWQAFDVTLHRDDPQALATYRQKDSEANEDARALARLLPHEVAPAR